MNGGVIGTIFVGMSDAALPEILLFWESSRDRDSHEGVYRFQFQKFQRIIHYRERYERT